MKNNFYKRKTKNPTEECIKDLNRHFTKDASYLKS